MKNKVFLLPSLKSPYEPVAQLARQASDKGTIITDDIKKIQDLLCSHKISKIVIVMGAGRLNPFQAYNLFKKVDPQIDITVVDGWNWNIPGQIFLPAKNTVKTFKKALMS
jgi:hypothetical protein